MLSLTASLAVAILATPSLAQNGYVDLSVYGGVPDSKGAGILYGVPNDQAYYPSTAPARSVWGGYISGAGISWLRAGGAQTPYYGYSAGINNGNFTGYTGRFASAKSNYKNLKALNPSAKFVLLPHDVWGADGVEQTTRIFPCDDGDCTNYGKFLDRLISDLKSNNMTTDLYIDIWNEPDGYNFWPRSQDQYFQQWDYAYNKYRAAFGTNVALVGPSTASQPALNNGWWTNYAQHIKNTGLIPDWYSAHQLNGRGSANCGNDPVVTLNQLNQVRDQYGLPARPFQLNEYAAPDEQTPAYTGWFIERFERTGIIGLRANWGSGVGLHNDLAKLLGPGGQDKSSNFYKLGDWHVLNYYTKVQKGAITLAGSNGGNLANCYDLYVTQERNNGLTHILAGTRGQTGSWPITVSNVNNMPAYQGKSTLRAVIKEIPYNNGGRVDNPTTLSNGTVAVTNNQVQINLNMNLDSAYTIDLYPS